MFDILFKNIYIYGVAYIRNNTLLINRVTCCTEPWADLESSERKD